MSYIGQAPFQEFSSIPSKDSFTGDGSTTTFDLANDVVRGGENALEVYINNVRQEPGSGKSFTLGIDGSNNYRRITFTAAPASGAAMYVINDKTNLTAVAPIATDLNGVELVFDVDGDTTIHADTDDEFDIRIAGSDHLKLKGSSGDTVFKPMVDGKDIVFQQYDGNKILEINDANFVAISGAAAGPGELRFYEDTDLGALYTGFKAGNVTSSVSYVLPLADGTSGYALTTDGSGTLSWTIMSANTPTSADGQALGSASLEWSDLFLADSGTLTFGNDQDTILTHTDGSGLTLNSTNKLMFNDASQFVQGSSATVLSIGATDEIDLTATAIDINGTADVSGAFTTGSTIVATGVVTAAGFTIGSAVIGEAELEMLDGITAGTAAASKALVLDGSKNIATIGTIASAAITSSGIVTATAFTAGSAVLAEAELELLDGLTAGTAIASKVVTTDASIDTTGQRNLTISGELDAATLDISGAVDIAGTTTAVAITASGLVTANADMLIGGTTPTLTIGDAGAEDTKIVFDGNAQDYYIGLDDSSDSFVIGLGSTLGTTVHIHSDSTGQVTKPLQTAFSVVQSTGISAETVDDNTATTIGLNAEVFDVGGNFTNSVFTAPVTGKYYISGRIDLDAGTSSETKLDALNMHLITSNRNYYITATGTILTTATDSGAVNGSVVADMDANDTLILQAYCKKNGATTSTTTVQTSNTNTYAGCWLTGYLLG